jgi:uncharacterized protein YlxW (UPF0749 family)
MKSLPVIVIFVFALTLCACTKSDTAGTKQENKTVTPVVQADSAMVDSVVSDLQKKTDELKNDAEDLQKAVDDLLK